MTHRAIFYNGGRDRRRFANFRRPPYQVRADYAGPQQGNSLTRLPPAYSDVSTTEAAEMFIRPYVVADPRYSTDSLGQPFPSGTVFVQINNTGDWDMPTWNLRVPVTPGNPLITNMGTPFSSPCDLAYSAYGFPAGATVNVIAQSEPSNTTLFNINATPITPNFLIEIPRFSFPSADTGWTVITNWTGGTPIQEGLNEMPSSDEGSIVAVPSTMQAGYTLNLDTTNSRSGTFGFRTYGDNRRLRAGPNTTYASMGITNGFGFGVSGGNVWLPGGLQAYSWYPIAIGQAVFGCGATYLAGIGPTGVGTLTTPGLRYAQVTFVYTKISADPGPSDTFVWTLKQDGTVIAGPTTVTGAAIMSQPLQVVSVSLPAAGVTTTFEMDVNGTGTFGPGPHWSCEALMQGSPRCDIPLPFTVVGQPGICAPGQYLPSKLSNPTNIQPLTRLAAGATSTTLTSKGNVAFIPSADGWYQVTQDGAIQPNIGEDEFGWMDIRTIRRGHAGRSFYARCDAPAFPSSTLALVATAPPAPTVIANTGTQITLNPAGGIQGVAWCSIALPGAGSWSIAIALQAMAGCGIVAGLSLTDPTVQAPSLVQWWEPYIESGTLVFSGSNFKGRSSTPAPSPADYDSWIVGPNPTGLWATHANQIAIWDPYVAAWQFQIPAGGPTWGSMIPNFPAWWFDGLHWHSNGTDPQLSFGLTTTGAQTVYLCIEPFDGVAPTALGGSCAVSWGPG